VTLPTIVELVEDILQYYFACLINEHPTILHYYVILVKEWITSLMQIIA